MTPRISVVIVSFNKREFVAEVLAGLRAQSCRDFETILVDNGSSDGTGAWVTANSPEVRLIALGENTGFARGNNIGIQAAGGDYVVLLNNDAVPEPPWMAELVRAAAEHPEAGFFASRVVRYDRPDFLDSAGDGLSITGTAFRRGHGLPAARYARPEWVFGASGSAACYRRAVLQDIGLFDEDLFAVYEDVDLSFRAQLAGFKCLYVPTAVVRHRGSSTIGKYTDFYVYQTQRNVELFFFKDMPGPLLWLLMPLHLVYNLAGWSYFTLVKRRGRTFVRAKVDALKQLSGALQKRKRVQAGRRVSIRYLISLLEGNWLRRTAREKLAPAHRPAG